MDFWQLEGASCMKWWENHQLFVEFTARLIWVLGFGDRSDRWRRKVLQLDLVELDPFSSSFWCGSLWLWGCKRDGGPLESSGSPPGKGASIHVGPKPPIHHWIGCGLRPRRALWWPRWMWRPPADDLSRDMKRSQMNRGEGPKIFNKNDRLMMIDAWSLKLARKMNVRSRSPAPWLDIVSGFLLEPAFPWCRSWLGSGYPTLVLYPAVKKEKKSLPRHGLTWPDQQASFGFLKMFGDIPTLDPTP